MRRHPTSAELEAHIFHLHKLDRTHYDTPGSVMHCSCKQCNTARKVYGKRLNRHRVMAEVLFRCVQDGQSYPWEKTREAAENYAYGPHIIEERTEIR